MSWIRKFGKILPWWFWWPQFWPHIKTTLVLSLELVNLSSAFFRLSMRCVVFELAGGGTYVPPPAVRRWLRPPAVRGFPRPVIDATPPHEFFWAGRHIVWRIVLKFSIAYGASFAQLLVKKNWSGQVRSRSYDVIRGTTFARFQRNRE